ncbi:bile acid:sodium symporter [Candidatus Actinomarina]|nr:bile acid:sodium symporter [Candidatus Actinomarina sp.]
MGEIVDSAVSFKIIPFFIPILFYFLGLNTETTELKKLITEKKTLIYGLTFQIIFLPLVGIALSNIFKTSIFSTAVVLVLLVPGGHISGLLTHIKKGNIALSVGLTSTASLLAPFTIVLWLNILIRDSEEFSINFLQTFLQLVILVLIPFLAGIYTVINKPTLAEKLSGRLDRFLKVVVLVLTFSGPIEIRELLLDNFFEGFKLAFLALIAIYLLNVVGSKTLNLSNKNSQTITIEGLCQNFPIVLVLAATLNMPELIVFGVIYYLISTALAVSYAFLKNI